MTVGSGKAWRDRHANADPPPVPEPVAPRRAPARGRAGIMNRHIAIAIAVLGLIGVLVPLSLAAVDALAVARADLGTFTVDDVANFLTSAGGDGNLGDAGDDAP